MIFPTRKENRKVRTNPPDSNMAPRERTISGRVRFTRPVIEELARQGLCAIDMHCHTCHSDAPVRVRDALSRASALGIGLSITDHNEVSGCRQALASSPGSIVIPGIEISALDGPHILVYFSALPDLIDFYRSHIERKKQASPYLAIRLTTSEILDRVSGYHCLCTAAHPFGYLLFNKGVGRCVERNYLPPEIIKQFDAVEAICGGMSRSGNIQAAHLAARFNLGIVGGSDAHLLRDIGTVVTCAQAGSVDEFLENIIKHQNTVIGSEKSLPGKGLTGMAMIMRYLPYTLPSLSIHFEQNLPRLQRFFGRGRRRR
ncbi:MAG TPA: PHP-associated domain-containing protein [Methanoregulaceae archaeon]|nr:PHP-associated domain-containing protein [Methanoregulaceae archaeon]HPD10903.1 PHP-associated domain-containing protein [Methanoregulaceae archaeon]HRT16048.1 PHP-associated domain-containing protein [Methanoregulaceae archaeon]HRU31554.1 PHP-associated domain-containing protein [Methanoregulaceae archaeon]